MSTTLTCEQCLAVFNSNFRLYDHKVKEHGPALAIVSKSNLKRSPAQAEPGDHPTKYVKVGDHVGGIKRRYSGSDDDENPAKIPRENDKQGIKRSLHDSSDGDDDTSSKRRKLNERQGIKRRLYAGTVSTRKYRKVDTEDLNDYISEDENEQIINEARYGNKKRKRSHETSEPCCKRERRVQEPSKFNRTLIDKLKLDVARWRRLYKSSNKKMVEMEKDCEERIEVFRAQIRELEELEEDSEMTSINKAVINSVTIKQFNKIRSLLEANQLSRVLQNKTHVRALQRLFLGLNFGVIPITQPQRIALSEDERNMVRKLENTPIDKVKSYIAQNKNSFLRLFEIINDSLQLITRSYERYGTN